LSLEKKWAYNIINNVGNYREVFECNVGKNTSLKLERGLNALWTQGVIQYAPPVK
jgi:general L-amino acid transport system substrate-binding protein